MSNNRTPGPRDATPTGRDPAALAHEAPVDAGPSVDSFLASLPAEASIETGLLVWTLSRNKGPTVPYEDLPFPGTERTKIPSCTVRWQFTGRFSLNREEDIACGSLMFQLDRFLARRGTPTDFAVTFPRGVGRGRFVDLTGSPDMLPIISKARLVFHGAVLKRHSVGAALSRTDLVVEVLGFPKHGNLTSIACEVATQLGMYSQVHHTWAAQVSFARDDAPPRLSNRLVALVSTPPGPDGGYDPANVEAIPGFLRLANVDCELSYAGRLEWCTRCKSRASSYRTFNDCPRRRCFNCGEIGHYAARCRSQKDFALDEDQ